MKRISVLVAILVAMLFLQSGAVAECIHLKDGRTFFGKVTEKDGKIQLDTGYGLLEIDKSQIASIEADSSIAPKPKAAAPKTSANAKEAILESVTSAEMSEHIFVLASKEYEGRMTGTEGMKKARDYVVKQFESYGLKPAGDSKTYMQKFPTDRGDSWNVVGYVEGSDPVLKSEVVIVGGHYDHVGRGRGGNGEIHPGADDNASGTAGVLEIAEAFTEKGLKPKRTILFICFGAEEIGLVGSRYYCEHPYFPLEKTTLVLNMDMIARNEGDKVACYGASLSKELGSLIDESDINGVSVGRNGMMPASDHYSFYVKGVPAVCFNTGMHKDLHQPTDTWEKCNFKKAEKIAEFVANLALVSADFDGKIGMEKSTEDESPWGRRRRGPRLGITPAKAEIDAVTRKHLGMGENDGGILIESVAPDSVAANGGLKKGDILIEFNGEKIPSGDMRHFFGRVLRNVAGKKVSYAVLRNGKKVTGKLEFPAPR